MLAVHLENVAVTTRDIPMPVPPPGHALLRLLVAGICNTDLELLRGYYGFSGIPGHEFVAIVENAGDRSLIGKRVVGEINLACTDCAWCRKGLGRHCPHRAVLGIVKHPGAFQQYFTLPERNLHAVPDELPTDRAVFTEPVAAACEILDQVCIPPNEKVAVLGDGKLGILIALVLNAHGYAVHHFGRHREKLRISRDVGVATHITRESLPVAAYEWVVEATGNPDGLRLAVQLACPRGTVILKSTTHSAVPMDTAPVVVNEITLVGSRCGRFETALPLLEHGVIRPEQMIAARFPLHQAAEAFARAADHRTLKVLLTAE
jgi:alcohol dehydrogenase